MARRHPVLQRRQIQLQRFDPVALNERICSPSTLEQVRRMLEGVVDTGTATNLKAAHFRIAGKTGTAQIAKERSGYKSAGVSYQASFAGYFPADAPRYSCIVVVSSPSMSGYYGNVVAGPIFKEIADKIHSNRLEMQTGLAGLAPPQERTPVTFGGHAGDLRTALAGLGVPVQHEGEGEWVVSQAADTSSANRRGATASTGRRSASLIAPGAPTRAVPSSGFDPNMWQ